MQGVDHHRLRPLVEAHPAQVGDDLVRAALRQAGYPPLILELLPNAHDDDHLLALFRRNGCWGAVAKSNFAGLRYREPVYRTLRELVLSFFEQYYGMPYPGD